MADGSLTDANRRTAWNVLAGMFAGNRMVFLAAVNIFMIAIMAPFYPKTFFAFDNFVTILLSSAMEVVLAIGMMFLVVAGEFDLSIGSNYALGGTIAALLMKQLGLPIPISIFAGIGASTALGLVNGLLVEKVGVNALIATLATMMIARALGIYLGGAALVDLPRPFLTIGQTILLGMRLPVFYMIVLVIIASILLSRHRFFRQFYLIGGNKRSAALSGVKVARVMIVNFCIMGFLAGLAGIITAARLNYIRGFAGDGLNVRILSAVIIGGGSFAGGKGTIGGALMGVLFLGLLQNIVIILGVSANAQLVVIGLVLIIAVILDIFIQRRTTA